MKPEISSYTCPISRHHIWELKIPDFYLATEKNARWKLFKWYLKLVIRAYKELVVKKKEKP